MTPEADARDASAVVGVVTDATLVTSAELGVGAPLVVLAPHPDDESLGCGALLADAFGQRGPGGQGGPGGAHVVCLTDGARSHPGSRDWPPERLAALRSRELVDALGRLGGTAADVTWIGHPDGALPASGEAHDRIVTAIVGICDRLGARTLLATSVLDHHADHKATASIALAVHARRPELRLLFYPVWARHDDPAGLGAASGWRRYRLPPGARATIKRRAIDAHASQHGRVVADDPAGFALDASMVERFATEDELYLEAER